jgi:hypothetical protein
MVSRGNLFISNRANIEPGGSVFTQHHNARNHVFGTCWTADNTDLMYVNIPKNASSWTKPNLISLGWGEHNYQKENLQHKHAIVVLRDPMIRWLSGVGEYFSLYNSNVDLPGAGKAFFELVLDLVTLDDHTERQVYFIDGLDHNNCTYFYCDNNYSSMFGHFLNSKGMRNRFSEYNRQHTTEQSEMRSLITKYFTPMLDDPKCVNHIKNHYKLDYELINRVKFYGRR